jgi:hypothetical protein
VDDFDLFIGDLPNDDSEVVAGMERLRQLRELESGIPEI